MKVYYWSPHIDQVATVKSVINSAYSLSLYKKKEFTPYLINVAGEWDQYENEISKKNIKIINLTSSKFIKNKNIKGFIKSRLTYIYLFVLSFFPLLRLLKKNPSDYFIIHLITPVPLLLNLLFNFKTKFILRVSGLPKLNFLRKYFWKITLSKISHVTCPTKATMNLIQKMKLLNSENISVLYDPVISNRSISNKKKEDFDKDLSDINNYYLAIGRLTKQKNFGFLIKVFSEFLKLHNNTLIIIGEGEERDNLLKLIKENNLENKIFLKGYKKNVYKYFEKSKCFILSSLWEDPGFVLIESAYMNVPIISSDCDNGPKEILDDGKNGILFKSNNKDSLLDALIKFENMDKKVINKKMLNCKKAIKIFTYFNHFKSLEKIL